MAKTWSADLSGQTCVVTGATDGVGRVTARELARMGAHVALPVRNREKGDAVAAEIRALVGRADAAALYDVDMASLQSVRSLATTLGRTYERIDVLVNNAGAIFGERSTTDEGFERTFAVNHLAYFALTNALLPQLERAPRGRIVNVASEAHRMGRLDFDDLQRDRSYGGLGVYSTSKLCNILFTYALARRLEGRSVSANCLHPGTIRSGFGRGSGGFFGFLVAMGRPFLASPERGARTQIYCAASPEVEGQSGHYFIRCKKRRSSRATYDVEAQERLWDVSAKLVGDFNTDLL